MKNKFFVLICIAVMPLLFWAAPNLDNPADLKNVFDGTITKALKKNSNIADLQVIRTGELAKIKGLNSEYVDSKVIKVLRQRAQTFGNDKYWKELFDHTMRKALQRRKKKFLVSDKLILKIAQLVKAEGLNFQYVNQEVSEVSHKRANIDIENLRNWFVGTMKSALNKNEDGRYIMADKQIKTTAQNVKEKGLESEYVDYLVDKILQARKNNQTVENWRNWFVGTMKSALNKNEDGTWVVSNKQIQRTADLVKALGVDPEYIDYVVSDMRYKRALNETTPNGSNRAIPVGKSYTDEAYTDEALVPVGSSALLPARKTETGLVPFKEKEWELLPAEKKAKALIYIAEPSLAVPYGSNFAIPVGKSYADEALVPVGSSALLPERKTEKGLVPFKENPLVTKTYIPSFIKQESIPQYLLTSKNIENINPEDVIIEDMLTDGLNLDTRFRSFEPEQFEQFKIEPIQFSSSIGKKPRTLSLEEIGKLAAESGKSLPKIEPIQFLPKMESQFGKVGLYGVAAGLVGLGLGTAYVYRNEIHDAFNRFAGLNNSETDFEKNQNIFQPNEESFTQDNGLLNPLLIEKLNKEKEKALKEQKKYNKIKKEFHASLASSYPF